MKTRSTFFLIFSYLMLSASPGWGQTPQTQGVQTNREAQQKKTSRTADRAPLGFTDPAKSHDQPSRASNPARDSTVQQKDTLARNEQQPNPRGGAHTVPMWATISLAILVAAGIFFGRRATLKMNR